MNHAVIGLGYGDEGKGVVTNYLCSQHPRETVSIRFSGGPQAAHTVYQGERNHIFSHFGSGTLSECSTFWSRFCTFDPIALMWEYKQLLSIGMVPFITVDPQCPVTTPYDILENQLRDFGNGTCGSGFYRTKLRHFRDGLTFTVFDLFSFDAPGCLGKMGEISHYYNDPMNQKLEHLVDEFYEALYFVRTCPDIAIADKIPDYPHRVYEGSQGLMLDEFIGHMPHCSPSDLTPRNALKLGTIDQLWLVTRCYQTRHGPGPMTNEDKEMPNLVNTKHETCLDNRFQGSLRRTILDVDQLQHAKAEGIDKVVDKDLKINLVVTCVDQMESYPVTVAGKVKECSSPEGLVHFLGRKLGIKGDYYFNDSPHSNLTFV